MSAITLTVGRAKNGSITPVFASGTASMSELLIGCHPRIDDPSKPTPSLNVFSSHVSIGYEQCCHVPRKSMNFRSTISALCFFAYSKNCFGVIVDSDVSCDEVAPTSTAPLPKARRDGPAKTQRPYHGPHAPEAPFDPTYHVAPQ